VLLGATFALIIAFDDLRRERILAYLDPWNPKYAQGKGYQLTHSLIAFGRGEIFGQGLGSSVEKLHYLPEAHTDFLLAVIGEELGFVGVACVIVAFFWLTRRIFVIGRQAIALDRVFAGLMVQGIGIWMGGQAFINMGVNLGVLPTKGLTLPLMSYGGSAILMNLVALAIVLRVDIENRSCMSSCAEGAHDAVTWSSWPPAPAATSSRAWRWRARCSAAAGASAGWAPPRHGKPARAAQAGIPLDTHRLQRPARQGPAAHGHRRPAAAQGLLGCLAHPAPARRQRGAGHGRLCVLSRRHDGQPAGQAADAGECRRRAAAVQQGAAAGGRPRGLRLRRRRGAAGQERRGHRQPGARRDRGLPARPNAYAGRSGPLRLLVVGGSLGAQVLNETLPAALALIPPAERPLVTHQTGAAHLDAVRAAYAAPASCRPRCCPSSTTWRSAGRCDLMVCRAGAITVSELCAAGVPSVLVPLIVSTTAHQRDNAPGWPRTAPPAPAAGRADARAPGRSCCSLTRERPAGHGEQARALARPQRPRRAWPTRSKAGGPRMKHAIKAHPLRRHRRRRHERHRRDPAQPGLTPSRAATSRQRHHAPPGRTGHARPSATMPRTSPAPRPWSPVTAVKGDNPEVHRRARARIPVVPRAVMLAELMRLKQGIAIAGTHGKTTTTSLVTSVLAEAGVDPTFVIGGKLKAPQANSRLGSGDYIVVEADESDASFLNLLPGAGVVTNIDADHMDTYGHDFARLQAPSSTSCTACRSTARPSSAPTTPACAPSCRCSQRPVVSYGLNEGADVRARATCRRCPAAQMRFTVHSAATAAVPDLPVTLNLAGEHNVRNALAAIAVATELELPDAPVAQRRWPVQPAWAAASSAMANCRATAVQLHADRRLRPPPGGDGRGAGARRAAPSRAGAWCWPSSRTATPARATASRTSWQVMGGPTRCC
jgi:hypothetical protein